MKQLSQTWFADGYIDFELKKYTLLAYLQEVNKHFNENKLYPPLADIIFHYNNLVSFRENKKYLQEHFPKRLTGLQLEKIQVLYEQMIQDDELMQQLEEIIEYSAAKMKRTISSGTELYEFIEENITINPVGIIPLEREEGYIFMTDGTERETRVFQYRLSIFQKHDEKYRSIKTEYIDSWQRNFVNTYPNIKAELIRRRTELPNPAAYSIETSLTFPLEESLLPIAKRSFARFLCSE